MTREEWILSQPWWRAENSRDAIICDPMPEDRSIHGDYPPIVIVHSSLGGRVLDHIVAIHNGSLNWMPGDPPRPEKSRLGELFAAFSEELERRTILLERLLDAATKQVDRALAIHQEPARAAGEHDTEKGQSQKKGA